MQFETWRHHASTSIIQGAILAWFVSCYGDIANHLKMEVHYKGCDECMFIIRV